MYSKEMAAVTWKTIASDLGLDFLAARQPALTGDWKGHLVNVKVFKEKQRGKSQFLTGFDVQTGHAFNTSFHLTRQGLIQNLADKIGLMDIQIGEPLFDSQVLITGWNEEVVKALFQDRRIRSACLNLFSNYRFENVQITNQSVSASVNGVVMTATEVKTILGQLLNVTLLLKESDSSIDENSETLEQSEIEVIAPESVQPLDVTEELDQGPEPSGEEEDSTETADATIQEPHPAPVDPKSISKGLSLSEIAEDLFSEKSLNFEDRFKGEEVDWEWEISHIVPGADELVFGENTGWIATFDMGYFPGMDQEKAPLKIKYRIDRKRKEAFDSRPGTKMKIQGKLVTFDTSANTLYIESPDPKESETPPSATILVHY